MNEWDIIERFFHRPPRSPQVILGVGDDAAVMDVPKNHHWVTSVDTLVEGTHFFPHAPPAELGYKSLAISLSDLAAMGAEPDTVLLALTLPEADEAWLQLFSQGFFSLMEEYQLSLIGGNIARGPLNISTIVHGWVPKNQAIRRSTAVAGDSIYITGSLGDAGLALDLMRRGGDVPVALSQRFYRPTPRVLEGLALRGLASAAIDISDGLAADLHKLLQASRLGAVIQVEKLPLSRVLQQHCREAVTQRYYALTAGEDYELCFTVSPDHRKQVEAALAPFSCGFHCIGEVTRSLGLHIRDAQGNPFPITHTGYEHFS
ncbi:MAG: thiamine-phosphate kinase [Gammaproteobacteria bacterium RIFCSPHIGHO2_12_FULL_41_15]|nr:MAG: thiamine-phosphate kinase [Gammaproteobacteria bacterium RIFCSPHIGHO2_12_FULL_41_15]